ncbi:MAG: IS110 family transposase [Kineosporiaceae bacterium]|nr:IS110 family transposase [Kineosporiaceae bacterium]
MSIPRDLGGVRVSAGVDWAKADHVVCVVGAEGEVIERFGVAHDGAGLKRMTARLLRAGVGQVGIERGDGPVVAALLAAGLTVYVIPPGQVKNLRSRYGSAGNKDDRFDAYVLADVVRTDARRLRPMIFDSEATTTMRASVRARRDLVSARVAVANQLLAHLQGVFPAASTLFSAMHKAVTLSFLEQFTTQEHADRLTVDGLGSWLTSVSYRGRVSPQVLHARLTAAPRGVVGATAAIHAVTTLALVAVLRSLNTQIQVLADSITEQLGTHPDRATFTSLPRSGTIRAARLLAEIGDARGRFPTPNSLAALAGVVPSTRRSGKSESVVFRWAADKQLRDALCDFAADSRRTNPWAAHLYDQARARGHDHPHAVRVLARAWVTVIWRCWQDHTPYDPTTHRALQTLLNQDQQEAA